MPLGRADVRERTHQRTHTLNESISRLYRFDWVIRRVNVYIVECRVSRGKETYCYAW